MVEQAHGPAMRDGGAAVETRAVIGRGLPELAGRFGLAVATHSEVGRA